MFHFNRYVTDNDNVHEVHETIKKAKSPVNGILLLSSQDWLWLVKIPIISFTGVSLSCHSYSQNVIAKVRSCLKTFSAEGYEFFFKKKNRFFGRLLILYTINVHLPCKW